MKRLAPWLRQEIPRQESILFARLLEQERVDTVCFHAHCPNTSRCFRNRCATFLILGPVCTRQCRFCAVLKSAAGPLPVDLQEPDRVARAVAQAQLSYCVITSVTRDDLKDKGAGQFVRTIRAIRRLSPQVTVEVLIPDFDADARLLQTVIDEHPAVIGHNLETVARLYPAIRPRADYRLSLEVLRTVKKLAPQTATKSSLMLGLSETQDEVIAAMRDLRGAGCEMLCLGQYLAPSARHAAVVDYLEPERFEAYSRTAYALGFSAVSAGPLVRSSFNAEENFRRRLSLCMTR